MFDIVWIDYVILGILVFSAFLGVMRGFFKEFLSLLTWIAAFFVAANFYEGLSGLFTFFNEEMLRRLSAIGALFLGTLIIGAIITNIVARFVHFVDFVGIDRILGAFFGVFRGMLIVCVLIFLINTIFPSNETINSALIPYFSKINDWFLPIFKGYFNQNVN